MHLLSLCSTQRFRLDKRRQRVVKYHGLLSRFFVDNLWFSSLCFHGNHAFLVTRESYFIGLKSVFAHKFWEFFQKEVNNIITRGNPEIELNIRKLKTSKFPFGWRGPLVAIFDHMDGSCSFRSQKWLPQLYHSVQRLATKLNTTSLGQSSIWTCCWPSWMAAVTRNHKNGGF